MERKPHPDAALIDEADGVTAVATLLGVEPNVVGNWKARGIPRPWRRVLKSERPDIDWTRAAAPVKEAA